MASYQWLAMASIKDFGGGYLTGLGWNKKLGYMLHIYIYLHQFARAINYKQKIS